MSLFRPHAVLLAALAFAVVACNDSTATSDNGPSLGGLRVTTTTNKDTIVIGDTALVTFRFTNPTDTTITLTSGRFDNQSGKPCPVLIPVAAYPGTKTVYSFILSTCFGGADTTLTGQYGLQNLSVPARGSIERTVPFTGFTRASPTATPRCLATGDQWVLPLFLVGGVYITPEGTSDTDGPKLLHLKPSTATPAPCSNSST